MPRPPTERQAIGAAAEDAAGALLSQHGLALLARNVRYPFGELDLVMLDGKTLAFVEVRQRKHVGFGGAAASVDRSKRRKIALAAQAWLDANPAQAKAPCRFDVVAVTDDGGGLRCEWLRAAFTLDDLG